MDNTKFIRSSWILSLLWTAKYYATLSEYYSHIVCYRHNVYIHGLEALFTVLLHELYSHVDYRHTGDYQCINDWILYK
jgi:hypothetical protein